MEESLKARALANVALAFLGTALVGFVSLVAISGAECHSFGCNFGAGSVALVAVVLGLPLSIGFAMAAAVRGRAERRSETA
ncbi:MAG: hypothetical protein ABR562_04785 [Thermoplasmatota archaeon]